MKQNVKNVPCLLERLKVKNGFLRLTLSFPRSGCRSVVICFRSRLAEERVEYPFELSRRPLSGGGERIRAQLDLRTISFKSLYWDLLARIEGEEEPVGLYMRYSYRLWLSFFSRQRYDAGNGFFLMPTNDARGCLTFQYRQPEADENAGFRQKETAAFLISHLFFFWWRSRRICLVYEKFCMMAQDNGCYFFRYCMEHDIERKRKEHIYYVLREGSPDAERLARWKDHVIPCLSLRHMIYVQTARLLISTDSRRHVYPVRNRGSLIRHSLRKKPLVFLQHGVTALKKVDFFYGKGQEGDCDLFIVTSRKEEEIVLRWFGYQKNEVANCGFARWDVLEDRPEGKWCILIMPTWRSWLENATELEFVRSDYYANYMALLKDPSFSVLLEEQDLEAYFYLHSKFRDFLSGFAAGSGRIHLIPFGSIPANELIMRCRMLVTDYSSVSWDVFYQGKPVVFFQFDRAQYLEAHGSYLDLERELFGPCVTGTDDLVRELKKLAEGGFTLSAEYETIRKEYFPRTDRENCRRIEEAIAARWP